MRQILRSSVGKAVLASLIAVAVAAGLVIGDTGGSGSPAQAAENVAAQQKLMLADMSGFQAGNIIDDSVFWNSNAMSQADIQAFLNAKVPTCAAGYTCLKNYTETTRPIAGTPMCDAYPGGGVESAATIIFKVAQTCGISPAVLLVILQKEQGLVTHSSPTAGRIRAAMGAGCPDTAACDANYYGFFNQVHYGAYLLKRYTQPAGTGAGTAYETRYDLRYPVGRTTAVLYHPNAACGTQPVTIQNQATHALYIYTPYTPNPAALTTSYQTGDACSSYGNRNFYSYYTDWFGSVRGAPVGSYFQSYYAANSSWLGYTTGALTCGRPDSGCIQSFQGGYVAGSYSTAAAGVRNDFLLYWGYYGRELGELRYPTGDRVCDSAGCRQSFQGGTIRSSASGAITVELTSTPSWLGTVRQAKSCTLKDGRCYTQYQNGWVVESPAGNFPLTNAVVTLWSAYGREYNILGFPTAVPTGDPTTGNYAQAFQGGVITVAGGTASLTSTSDPYVNATLAPWLGQSSGSKSCTLGRGGGCYQPFANGWVVQSSAGIFAVPNAVRTGWGWYGRETGPLGFPSGAPSASPTTGNYTQAFQGGVVTVSAGAPSVTLPPDPVTTVVQASPWLGSATQARSCSLKGGACYLAYQNGWVVDGPTGIFAVPNAVRTGWGWYGREYDVLGFPTGAPSASPTTGTYTQAFQGGLISVTAGNPVVTLAGDPVATVVQASPWLGTATQPKSCTLKGGACFVEFQNGWVVQGPTGVFAVANPVRTAWGWYGREYDVLGFPTGAPSANPSGGTYTQTFQGGTITVTAGNPSVTLR